MIDRDKYISQKISNSTVNCRNTNFYDIFIITIFIYPILFNFIECYSAEVLNYELSVFEIELLYARLALKRNTECESAKRDLINIDNKKK